MISINRFLVLFALAVAVAAVPQAAPAQPENLDACAKNCFITSAAQSSCVTANNIDVFKCLCTNQAIEQTVAACVKKACVPQQVTILQEIQREKCVNVNPVVNGKINVI